MSNLCRRILPLAVLVFGTALLLLPTAQADYESYHKQYGNNRVRVQLGAPGAGAQEWFMTGLEGKMLEIALPSGDAMALSIEDPSLQGRLFFQAADPLRIGALQNSNSFETLQHLLRPTVYPLLRFAALPENFVQFYDPIDYLIVALIEGGQLEEASQILANNTGLLVQPRFQQRVFALIEAFAAEGESAKAVQLLALIPLEQVPQGLKNALLSFAYRLRVQGEYEALIPVYESMIPMLGGAQKAEAQIWLAYCLIQADKRTEAEALLAEMPKPEPGQEGFGLYQLLSGYSLYRDGQYAEALDVLAKGLVYASSIDSWIPEISYYIGNCYRELDKANAARSTYMEIFRLWPDNPWAKRAREALDAMPPVTQPT